MDPQEQEHTPEFELPAAQSPEQQDQAMPEQQAKGPEFQYETSVEKGLAQPPPAPPAPLAPVAPVPPAQAISQANSGATQIPADWLPQIADDADLIEKEWVTKAKQIVAKTSHDPHLQNIEMNKFKADYLKKRYNKEVKLSDDS